MRKLPPAQKRKRARRISNEHLTLMGDKVVADLRMDVIGWDSCVLAVRLLHERLKAIRVDSEPLQCRASATYNGHEVRLCRDGGGMGHAMLLVGRTMIDMTLNQIHEMDPRFPELQPVFFTIDAENAIACEFACSFMHSGVRIYYEVDRTTPPYFLDGFDWTNSMENINRIVALLEDKPEHHDQIRAMIRQYRGLPK